MIVGAGSESYRTLRYLVERLPLMLAPAWLKTPTQAIAIADVLRYLPKSLEVAGARGREIQIGSPEILSYGAMLDEMADALGMPPPAADPGAAADARGCPRTGSGSSPRSTPASPGRWSRGSRPTRRYRPSGMALFEIEPIGFDEALQAALAEEREGRSVAGLPAGRCCCGVAVACGFAMWHAVTPAEGRVRDRAPGAARLTHPRRRGRSVG